MITDQPIVPTSNEVYRNKASRSAKMRVIQKN
ncbi:16S rRNA (cytosine(1402)-N(4))-methyltransferase [bacterium]|nr:16S rRNA (cytosine(1402)-N(4))-methyltransferase [bacterium]